MLSKVDWSLRARDTHPAPDRLEYESEFFSTSNGGTGVVTLPVTYVLL